MMEADKSLLGYMGLLLGSIALMLVLIHFYAGPFSPQPSLERTVAETAVSIRDATVAALRGEEIAEPQTSNKMDIDRVLETMAAGLGGLAIILGFGAFSRKEPKAPAGGAVLLGVGAVGFQFLAAALGILVFAILVYAVISTLGLDFLS